jgi:hypothetical protein
MKYAVQMGSGAMINIQSLIKIGSGIQKLIGEINRQHGDLIGLFYFSQNKKSSLKQLSSNICYDKGRCDSCIFRL